MKSSRPAAFTRTELLVALLILVILGAILAILPVITRTGQGYGTMTQTLSNMRQLHIATQQMALDGVTSGDTNLGWPGDTGGTFTNWTTRLVTPLEKGQLAYLTTNDLCKLLSAPGKIVKPGKLPTAMSNTAILVHAVKDESDGSFVFLTSANFTNTPAGGAPLDPAAKPYGNKGFVIFRKSGDGAILLPKQVGQTNVIGAFAPLLR